MQTTQAVTLPLPGLETVVVCYNMMGSEEDYEIFGKSLGEEGKDKIIVSIENWPTEQYGEPFSRTSPMAARMWICKRGLELAMAGFLATMS